jgi:hypothetical protein
MAIWDVWFKGDTEEDNDEDGGVKCVEGSKEDAKDGDENAENAEDDDDDDDDEDNDDEVVSTTNCL